MSNIFHRLGINSLSERISTSLSDNQAYPQICMDASNDYRVFNNFRRNRTYNKILEHMSEKQGAEYLQIINEDKELLTKFDIFKANDDHGNPRIYEYPIIGKTSPSTLRYVKVLLDLKNIFSSLDKLKICEIGVGYGGQCRVINAYNQPKTYTLVDIQPALALSQRYLDNFVLNSTVSYKTMNELETDNYDLVISNYAFTELPRTVQDAYLQKTILHSKKGYITYNDINPEEFRSYKLDELLEIIPGSRAIKEEPLTHPKNCIIVWGDNN